MFREIEYTYKNASRFKVDSRRSAVDPFKVNTVADL